MSKNLCQDFKIHQGISEMFWYTMLQTLKWPLKNGRHKIKMLKQYPFLGQDYPCRPEKTPTKSGATVPLKKIASKDTKYSL